jgi:hypothetical protein
MNEAARLTIAAVLIFITVVVLCVILEEWPDRD